MPTRIMYPWVISDIMHNDLNTEKYSLQESIALLSNFNAITDKLKSVGEVDVGMVEDYFQDEHSTQSKYLVKVVKCIQECTRQRERGAHIITDDPVTLNSLLHGLAYTWALTLNKSAGVYQTRKISKLCHQYNTSFNSEDFQERFDQLRYMSLLVFTEFHPINGKYTISSAPELTDLVSSRVRDIKDSFTIVVSTVDTHSIALQKYTKKVNRTASDDERIYQSLATQMHGIKEVYGTYINNILERNFKSVVLLLGNPEKKQTISYLK